MTKNPWLVFRLKLKISIKKLVVFSFIEKLHIIQFHSMEKMIIIQFHSMEKVLIMLFSPNFGEKKTDEKA